MRRQLRNLRFWLLMFPLGWLVMVALFISQWPDPGAASPDELAGRVAESLRAHDAKKLAPLFSVGGEEIAQETTTRFTGARVVSARFSGGAVVVEFVRVDGTSGTVTMPVEETDGRWRITPVVAP
ncbi:hypothetical protein FKR81_24640 [Lentzea tibetensis]|uniref:DUF4878 domain-containing protein n=1 Tax=Lentzea tibetensis TaxID=2591470 RepID=A0A563EPC6_9PSEU|nr:hypothetical protein [Lentzea tibetensis]TWP49302.1 hypothetical protein FKR81_24640 [Lentzea tibetensis]